MEKAVVMTPAQIGRLLTVIETEIVPLTRAGVARGDKVFGAAILRADDLSTIVAATNRETENPLFHGEISAINAYWRATGLADLIAALPETERAPLEARLAALRETYAALSATYQAQKGRAPNILLP
jgi:hypothetical protein